MPFGDEKNAEREIIHGRWAMLGTMPGRRRRSRDHHGSPRGRCARRDDCPAVADKFPGAVAPGGEGSGYPSFWAVLALELFLVGSAESYAAASERTRSSSSPKAITPGGRRASASPRRATSKSSRLRSLSTAACPCSRGWAASCKRSPPKKDRSPTGRARATASRQRALQADEGRLTKRRGVFGTSVDHLLTF